MELETRFEFAYAAKLRKRWRSGRKLARNWYEQYPFLDPADWDSAKRQRDDDFLRWYAAIQIYEETGWFSLIAKYDLQSHPRKLCILRLLLTPKQVAALDQRNRPCRPPDLLVYNPDLSDFYFCEVKGPEDSLRDERLAFFGRLTRNVGRKVCLAELREA